MKTLNNVLQSILLASLALLLVSCGSTGGTASTSTAFGLDLSNEETTQVDEQYSGVRLDVIVPVFKPGIPDDPDDYEKLGIWPELRRLEAVRFARLLKNELQETGNFGDVRVAPDTKVAGELYVSGEILKSNGEDIEIRVKVYDISGKRWLNKKYKHRVKEYFWQDMRSSGKDPYQPVFKQAAIDVVESLNKRSQTELTNLRNISEIIFAKQFAQDAFSEHIELDNKQVKLVSLPAVDDPMLVRTRAIRVTDKHFMDQMQTHYDDLVSKTDSSYVEWQKFSVGAAKAARNAKSEATGKAILGALLLIGAAAAADAHDNNYSAGTATAITAAAIGGVIMLQKSFQQRAEGKFHLATLNELGQSLNFEVAPKVIEVENDTLTLRGGVMDQHRQWKNVLKQMYELESVPNVQL